MKVLTSAPVGFLSGDVLAPEDLNRAFLYAKDALGDVAQKRWAKAPLPLQFVEAVDGPYTNAMNAEELRYRFTCPVNCVVERAFLHGNLTCAAELQIVVEKASDSSTLAGATVPLLTTKGAIVVPTSGTPSQSIDGIIGVATSDVVTINTDKFLLLANVEYWFRINGGGVFTANRLDVILHVAVDRWNLAGALSLPDFQPTMMTDASGADATIVAANQASFSTQVAKLANALGAPMPTLFALHGPATNNGAAGRGFVSGTPLANRRFTIPRQSSARALMKLKRIYLYCFTAGACTITARLRDQAGTQVGATITAVVPAGGQASVDSGALNVALDGGTPEDVTKDYTLEFANSDGAVSGTKVYALAWVARG